MPWDAIASEEHSSGLRGKGNAYKRDARKRRGRTKHGKVAQCQSKQRSRKVQSGSAVTRNGIELRRREKAKQGTVAQCEAMKRRGAEPYCIAAEKHRLALKGESGVMNRNALERRGNDERSSGSARK